MPRPTRPASLEGTPIDIIFLVERLESLIANGKKLPLTTNVVVDQNAALGLIDELRVAVPEEVRAAKRINSEGERIIEKAQEEAERIVAKAQEQAAFLIDERGLTQSAEAQSREIIANAHRDADEIRRGADEYAVGVLVGLEGDVVKTLQSIKKGIALLDERRVVARDRGDRRRRRRRRRAMGGRGGRSRPTARGDVGRVGRRAARLERRRAARRRSRCRSDLRGRGRHDRPRRGPAARRARSTAGCGSLRTNRGILAHADLRTALALECSRCLRDIELPVEIRFQEEYLPALDLTTGRPLPVDDEPDVARLTDHHELDLETPVREAIQLAEPIAPLYRPDCPGLCIVCGLPLDEGEHDHPDEDIDPRMEALQGFRPDELIAGPMSEGLVIRVATTDADLETWRQVRLAVLPNERALSVAEMRATDDRRNAPAARRARWQLAGSGLSDRSSFDYAGLHPRVLPGMRRRGVGTAILRALADHAMSRGFSEAGSIMDDAGSLVFAERFGFREVDRQIEQTRTIGMEPEPVMPDGIRVVTVAGASRPLVGCLRAVRRRGDR